MAKRKRPAVRIDVTELTNNFKTAKDKRMQIDIEADLHCCAPRLIAEELYKAGALEGTGIMPWQFSDEYVPVPPARPRSNKPRPTFDEQKALALFAAGVTYAKMGKLLGVTDNTIKQWTRRRGLSRKPAMPAQKEKEEDVKEDNDAKFEKIVESVDEGARNKPQITCSRTEPCDPCVAPARETCDGCKFNGFVPVKKRPPANIRMEPREAADEWQGYTVPEPVREPETFTLGALKAYLTEFLPARLNSAVLCIDGAPVTEFYGFSVTQPNGVPTVDLLTRRGA